MGARHDPSMALRLIYLMLFKFLGWTVLRARAETAKEIEILVLRHQLAGHCCIGRVLARAGWAVSHRPAAVPRPRSSFAGFRFPPEVIILALRWYLSCFAVLVDHVPAAAQAARTAWVSCGVACPGHGPRNLAAMMTRRSLTVISS